MIVFLNGKFVKKEQAKVSIFDHGFLYGDGVYETLRTYRGKIWQIKNHLTRLQRSAKLLQLTLPYSTKKLEFFLKETVKKNGFTESRIRITLTRGINNFNFNICPKPTLCIQVQPLKLESEKTYQKGVKIITIEIERILPQAKTISLLPFILGQQKAAREKAFEAIFMNKKGYVLEGTMTNIFIVKNNGLITPKNDILAGTTRKFILDMARKNDIKTKIADFTLDTLYQADEVFITNAPRGIIPVQKINKKNMPSERQITQKLIHLYEKAVS